MGTGCIYSGNLLFDFFWWAFMFDSWCTAIEVQLQLEMKKIACNNTIILQLKPRQQTFCALHSTDNHCYVTDMFAQHSTASVKIYYDEILFDMFWLFWFNLLFYLSVYK